MMRGWRRDKIQNELEKGFGAVGTQVNLRWRRENGIRLRICPIEVGVPSAWQEGVKDIRIYRMKLFRKMRYLLWDLIIIMWELKGKEVRYLC